jgi:hypothetical protein
MAARLSRDLGDVRYSSRHQEPDIFWVGNRKSFGALHMISYYPAPGGSIALVAPTTDAYSDAAQLVDHIIEKGLRHYAEPRMEMLGSEIYDIMAETARDAGAVPVDFATATAALQFAYSLPRSLPNPEIAPDPDGDISFDWLGPSGKMFSVSVSGTGRVAYAGRFGDKSKIHGLDQLSASCPPEIVRGISRAIA